MTGFPARGLRLAEHSAVSGFHRHARAEQQKSIGIRRNGFDQFEMNTYDWAKNNPGKTTACSGGGYPSKNGTLVQTCYLVPFSCAQMITL